MGGEYFVLGPPWNIFERRPLSPCPVLFLWSGFLSLYSLPGFSLFRSLLYSFCFPPTCVLRCLSVSLSTSHCFPLYFSLCFPPASAFVSATTKAVAACAKALEGTSLRVGAYPNAFPREKRQEGYSANNTLLTRRASVTEEKFVLAARGWVAAGASIVGGCCGVHPEHIQGLADAFRSGLVSAGWITLCDDASRVLVH